MARKTKDIRRMEDEDLALELASARRKLFDLRSQGVTEKIEDTSQFAKMRKRIARLLTEQNERARAQAS